MILGISIELANKVLAYLQTQPYNQVVSLINEFSQIKVINPDQPEQKDGVKSLTKEDALKKLSKDNKNNESKQRQEEKQGQEEKTNK